MHFFTHMPIQCANHTELAGRKKETEGSEQQLYYYGGTLGFYKDSVPRFLFQPFFACGSVLSYSAVGNFSM